MNACTDVRKLEASPANAGLGEAVRRAAWLKLLMKWHWISSAISLVGMLFFAVSGITLNNAGLFESNIAQVSRQSAVLPPAVLTALNAQPEGEGLALPAELETWLREDWRMAIYPKAVEWLPDEVFIDLKRPGVDAWLSINRHDGKVEYESSDRGWVAYFNDLHKGRNAGAGWSWFINLFGAACVIFSVTGLLILQVHARSRWSIWPVTAAGLLLPVLLMLLCVH